MAAYNAADGVVPEMLGKRGSHWYGEIVIPVMLAHTNGTDEVFTLNMINDGIVDWMPEKSIVETPTVVSKHGFTPLQPGKTPPDLQAMVRLNAVMEMLWVESVVERDYDKALRAMVLNHLVSNLDTAKAILDEIWKFEV